MSTIIHTYLSIFYLYSNLKVLINYNNCIVIIYKYTIPKNVGHYPIIVINRKYIRHCLINGRNKALLFITINLNIYTLSTCITTIITINKSVEKRVADFHFANFHFAELSFALLLFSYEPLR